MPVRAAAFYAMVRGFLSGLIALAPNAQRKLDDGACHNQLNNNSSYCGPITMIMYFDAAAGLRALPLTTVAKSEEGTQSAYLSRVMYGTLITLLVNGVS